MSDSDKIREFGRQINELVEELNEFFKNKGTEPTTAIAAAGRWISYMHAAPVSYGADPETAIEGQKLAYEAMEVDFQGLLKNAKEHYKKSHLQ